MPLVPASFDDLDRRIIAALQRNGRASWTEIAEQSGTSLATATRRGQALLQAGVVRVGVSTGIHAPGTSDMFLLRIGCRAGRQMQVAQQLAERTDLRFLSVVTGSCDLLAELVCERAYALHLRLVDEIQTIDGVEVCESDLVLHTYKISQTWARSLIAADEPGPSDVVEPHDCEPSHFDETDLRILALLREDGRATLRSVGEVLGVNETTVRRRFEAMRERGCAWLLTLVAAAALGFESEIIFSISVVPSRLEAVARELSSYVGVRYLAATLSCSLVCEVILPSTEDVYDFVTHGLGKIEGVLGWTSNVELLTLKRGFLETPWWRGAMEDTGAAAPALRLPRSASSATGDVPAPGRASSAAAT